MSDNKTKLIWFVDCSGMQDYQAHAKCKQLATYTSKTKFFNAFHVLIIPSKENKFQILEDQNDLGFLEMKQDKKEFDNWLATIKNRLRDCITVNL